MFFGRWGKIEVSFIIELRLGGRRGGVRLLKVAPPPGGRRAGEEVADIVTVDEKRVPFDKCTLRVHETRGCVVVEEEGVATDHL